MPLAQQVHADTHELIAVVGPWGSGKSTIAAFDLYQHCLRYRCDALVVRDTYPALRDSCVKKFMEIFQGAGELSMGPPPTFRWHGELRGREVLFRSAESPEDIQKFGSVEVGYAWMEEVTPGLMPGGAVNLGMSPEVLSGVLGRIRKWHVPGGKRRLLLSALPPPTTRHWFYSLFYDRRPLLKGMDDEKVQALTEQVALYKLTGTDNLANLPPNYYELQTAFLTSQDQVDRFINGEVGSGYGSAAIYAEQWNDSVHISTVKPAPGPLLVGLDGGLDAAAVWLQQQPSGHLFVLGELATHGLGLEDFGHAVNAYTATHFGAGRALQVWCDPAIFSRSQNDATNGAQHLARAGLFPRPGPQKPDIRWSAVRFWLSRMDKGGALLQVHPRCDLLIEGFRGAYHWKIAGGVPLVGTADKNEFSHPHDALQYPLAALYGRSEGNKPLPPLPNVDMLGRTPINPFKGRFARRHK